MLNSNASTIPDISMFGCEFPYNSVPGRAARLHNALSGDLFFAVGTEFEIEHISEVTISCAFTVLSLTILSKGKYLFYRFAVY